MNRPGFSRFADCLLAGVLLLLASLPVVTVFPALVAACAVLRDQAHGGEGVTVRRFLDRLRSVLRTGPAVWIVPTGVLVLLWLDAVTLDAHGPGSGPVLAVAAAVLAALGLRCAAAWREGERWRTTLAAVFRSVPRQPLPAALLAGAVGAAFVLLTMSPVLLLIVLGPLAFAATAADAWRPVSPR
ncbi:DUF624 domain-containing protein [Streptomyces sp. NPDC004539]|uniref:DUF624 domain-containing protein n=1 Tax=Streptomyces sp. NPDC004539 TaxID=3154280 RepID=UPI0033B32C43